MTRGAGDLRQERRAGRTGPNRTGQAGGLGSSCVDGWFVVFVADDWPHKHATTVNYLTVIDAPTDGRNRGSQDSGRTRAGKKGWLSA